MHAYNEFFTDTCDIFLDLIETHKPVIEFKSDIEFGNYSVKFIFKYSRLSFDLDRMDLQSSVLKLHDSSKYDIIETYEILYSRKPENFKTDALPQTRDFVVEKLRYLHGIVQYLENVLNGDFTWTDIYEKEKKESADMIARVFKLDYNSIIYQKFITGDESWKNDLRILNK